MPASLAGGKLSYPLIEQKLPVNGYRESCHKKLLLHKCFMKATKKLLQQSFLLKTMAKKKSIQLCLW